MVDVIIPANTRPASGDVLLNLYSTGAVVVALKQKGLDVRCVDLLTAKGENAAFSSLENSAEVCCYAVFFGNKVSAFEQMQKARQAKNPPRLIIAFGPFAAAFPEEILLRGLADVVVAHDPEFVIPAVIQEKEGAASWGTIPNLSFLSDGKTVHTPKHSFHDLDAIPFISPYLYDQGHRPALVMSARGCQYHCIYCDRNALWGGGVRNRSMEQVIKEVKVLVEEKQVRRIQFLDEDLAADHHRLKELCEGMRRVKGEFSWTCCACVDSVSPKMLLLMGHSRCSDVYFGVESASPQVLRRIGKTYGREEILNAAKWAQEAGLKVGVMITIGNPGEGDLDREMTLSALEALGPEIAITTNWLVVLPGTALYRRGLKEGWYTPKSYFEDEEIFYYKEKELA